MDKYLSDLIDAHWTVAEKAFSERSIEDLRQLLDRIEALSGSGSREPVSSGDTESVKSALTKQRVARGTTAKLKSFIEERELFERFLVEALSLSDSFSPKQFRRWLARNWGKELDGAASGWQEVIGTLIKYYSSPDNEFYKRIERIGPGQYTILSRMNGNSKQPNLFV